MNTKKRLSEDIENEKEQLLQQRFVTLYEDEISHILEKKEDLAHLNEMEEEEASEIEEAARFYQRIFARNFYDASKGRVSDEEFFPLWERENELMTGLQSIHSLEGEKKQLEKEIDIAVEEEEKLLEETRKTEENRKNKKAVFHTFLVMAIAAAVLVGIAIWHFKIDAMLYIWQITAAALVVVCLLMVLYHMQKKAVDREKLYRMMSSHKINSRKRMESDFQDIGNDLKFYYEKYEVLFGYIKEEQWELFEFCIKISEGLAFCGGIKERGEKLLEVLRKYNFKEPESWLYYPKALYEFSKRANYLERLEYQQDVCQEALVKHKRELDKNQEKTEI